jgi:hypothetical protein
MSHGRCEQLVRGSVIETLGLAGFSVSCTCGPRGEVSGEGEDNFLLPE